MAHHHHVFIQLGEFAQHRRQQHAACMSISMSCALPDEPVFEAAGAEIEVGQALAFSRWLPFGQGGEHRHCWGQQ